jgi:uncharacterized protein YecE (DUF72 family)
VRSRKVTASDLRIATAGWSIPAKVADRFPADGSGLQRYSARFTGVEINSTFYRSHRRSTFERWAETTPDGFRFSVKAPKTITHERRLVACESLLDAFLEEVGALGGKLGPVLVQLPPSLKFDAAVAEAFLAALRERWEGSVALEPRHASWFEADAEALLVRRRIARVAADPAKAPGAAEPGGWPGLLYWRLHGSPRMYWSAYESDVLETLAARLIVRPSHAWCVFDNTTSGAAAEDALKLQDLVGR